jgi:predicted RNA methylase
MYLEPSAGNGAFLDYLPNYIALDIKPENDRITTQNYLTYNSENTNLITIGNPPFGTRSKLAIDFFNKAATMSDVIAFIVPVSFMKWNVQKNLANDFVLNSYMYLEPESFLDKGEPYSIRTVF